MYQLGNMQLSSDGQFRKSSKTLFSIHMAEHGADISLVMGMCAYGKVLINWFN